MSYVTICTSGPRRPVSRNVFIPGDGSPSPTSADSDLTHVNVYSFRLNPWDGYPSPNIKGMSYVNDTCQWETKSPGVQPGENNNICVVDCHSYLSSIPQKLSFFSVASCPPPTPPYTPNRCRPQWLPECVLSHLWFISTRPSNCQCVVSLSLLPHYFKNTINKLTFYCYRNQDVLPT